MIKASEARELTNEAELKQIERDLDWIDRQIVSLAHNNCSVYNFCISHLSKSGQKLIKAKLEDAGYEVSFKKTTKCEDYYKIEW